MVPVDFNQFNRNFNIMATCAGPGRYRQSKSRKVKESSRNHIFVRNQYNKNEILKLVMVDRKHYTKPNGAIFQENQQRVISR
jgi:hypothetical protein